MSDDKDNDIELVRWVWIGLNIVLVIYGVSLIIYAKYWRKKEILVYVYILYIIYRKT
jgi:hypothetical protein